MDVSPEVQEAREETAKALGLRLTDGPNTEAIVCRPVAWGNSLVFRPGVVWFEQGDPGAGFVCGTRYLKRWGAQPGDRFNPIRQCPGRRDYYYQLCRPTIG